jgi:hypothetical protein
MSKRQQQRRKPWKLVELAQFLTALTGLIAILAPLLLHWING